MNSAAPSRDQLIVLLAMNKLKKHIYEGTVTEKVKARRRAKNRVAKQSRKVNR